MVLMPFARQELSSSSSSHSRSRIVSLVISCMVSHFAGRTARDCASVCDLASGLPSSIVAYAWLVLACVDSAVFFCCLPQAQWFQAQVAPGFEDLIMPCLVGGIDLRKSPPIVPASVPLSKPDGESLDPGARSTSRSSSHLSPCHWASVHVKHITTRTNPSSSHLSSSPRLDFPFRSSASRLSS
jgi:hypothetical protein